MHSVLLKQKLILHQASDVQYVCVEKMPCVGMQCVCVWRVNVTSDFHPVHA